MQWTQERDWLLGCVATDPQAAASGGESVLPATPGTTQTPPRQPGGVSASRAGSNPRLVQSVLPVCCASADCTSSYCTPLQSLWWRPQLTLEVARLGPPARVPMCPAKCALRKFPCLITRINRRLAQGGRSANGDVTRLQVLLAIVPSGLLDVPGGTGSPRWSFRESMGRRNPQGIRYLCLQVRLAQNRGAFTSLVSFVVLMEVQAASRPALWALLFGVAGLVLGLLLGGGLGRGVHSPFPALPLLHRESPNQQGPRPARACPPSTKQLKPWQQFMRRLTLPESSASEPWVRACRWVESQCLCCPARGRGSATPRRPCTPPVQATAPNTHSLSHAPMPSLTSLNALLVLLVALGCAGQAAQPAVYQKPHRECNRPMGIPFASGRGGLGAWAALFGRPRPPPPRCDTPAPG